MNGPDHYRQAEKILSEINSRQGPPQVAAAAALRALAHAMLAAAVAIGGRSGEERE